MGMYIYGLSILLIGSYKLYILIFIFYDIQTVRLHVNIQGILRHTIVVEQHSGLCNTSGELMHTQ